MEETATPTGTVTFLFTDIEGSTRAWQADPRAMGRAVADHDRLLRSCIEAAGGYVFALGGDSFAAAFQTVDGAVDAAASAQTAFGAYAWPTPEPLRVRMGIHTGSAEERAGNYFGPTVNRAARIMSAGHGGQVLLSEVSASLVGTGHGVCLLGERRLADVEAPELVHQLGDEPFPPLRAVQVFSCDVPVARTELFGREQELAHVDRSLQSSRLVTLVGAGGTGKTRRAFEAARAAQARFEAGVRLVDLTAVAEQGGVASGVATAVEAAPEQDATAAAVTAIGTRDPLLVIDNCEHVIDAVADCIDELLSSCPNLKVLATSREPLEVEGESVYPVPPLDPAGPAAELFRARVEATGVDPDQFDPTDITALCARLDGLPLAVELAAARARTLTPTEVIARLDAGADLGTGRRRRRRRHDTLEDTIAWSYDLLGADEQLVLSRCALFESDFPMDAIETTSGLSSVATVDALDGLVSKSLVVRDPEAGPDGVSRYRLLETIRDFAAQRLAGDDDLHDAQSRLVDYFVGLVDAWLAGSSRQQLLDEMVSQRATIAPAARHADASDRLEALGDIVQMAFLVWLAEPTASGPDELIDPGRLDQLPDETRGAIIMNRGIRLLNLGDIGGCLEAVTRAQQLSAGRDTHFGATALSVQARLMAYVDPEAALERWERSMAMRERAEPAPRTLIGGDAFLCFTGKTTPACCSPSETHAAAWDTLLGAARLGPDVNPLAHYMLLTDLLWTSILVERAEEGLELTKTAIDPQREETHRLEPGRRWLPIAQAAAACRLRPPRTRSTAPARDDRVVDRPAVHHEPVAHFPRRLRRDRLPQWRRRTRGKAPGAAAPGRHACADDAPPLPVEVGNSVVLHDAPRTRARARSRPDPGARRRRSPTRTPGAHRELRRRASDRLISCDHVAGDHLTEPAQGGRLPPRLRRGGRGPVAPQGLAALSFG